MRDTNYKYILNLLLGILTFTQFTSMAHAQAFVPVVEQSGPLLTTTEEIRDAVLTLPAIIGAAGNPDSLANLIGSGDPAGISLDPCRLAPADPPAIGDVTYAEDLDPLVLGVDALPDTFTSFIEPNPDYDHVEYIINQIVLKEFEEVLALGPPTAATLAAMDNRREELADEYVIMLSAIYYLPSTTELHDPLNPAAFYYTEVNDSGSLRCLLQELVEWRKLDLNLTIHQMVKEYFADAGVYVMSKRVQDIVAAATAEWAQSGMVTTLGPGLTANTSAFVDNPEAQLQRVNASIRGGVLDQLDPATAPAGYEDYNICAENVVYVYNDVSLNTIDAELDSLETFPNKVACSDNSADAVSGRQALAQGDLAAGGGMTGYIDYMYSTDNPIFASVAIQENTDEEIANAKEAELLQLDWGDGTLPTENCANPDDPYCRVTTVVTSAAVNKEDIDEIRNLTWSNLSNADEFGETPSSEQQSLSLDVTTNPSGLLNFDTDALRNPLLDPVDTLARSNQEFLWSIEAYFDVEYDTRNWAANSLIFTWDNVQRYAGLEDYLANILLLENL